MTWGSKDPGTKIEVSKEFELELDYDIDVNVDFYKDVDVDVDFSVEACVEGNTAILIFDAQAHGDDTYVEANVFVLTTDAMSTANGQLMAVTS